MMIVRPLTWCSGVSQCSSSRTGKGACLLSALEHRACI